MKRLSFSVLFVLVCAIVSVAGKPKVAVIGPALLLPPAPPLVLIAPGISVIPEFDHEVFVVSGLYWTFFDGDWYKRKGPKAKWIKVKLKHVPPGLVKIPRGKYLKFAPGKPLKPKPHKPGPAKAKHHKGKPGSRHRGPKGGKRK
ncbi:MAG: hypothetical protein GF418_08460 [Chitinivibrionales bacterium]|nr:hypothetical protein [Chitinivibrionales bacterium]